MPLTGQKKMIKFLYRINKSYDEIPDPYQFFTFVAFAVPGIVMMGASDIPSMIIGSSYIMILTVVRVLYLSGNLNKGKPDE
jgi:hypothetical protein